MVEVRDLECFPDYDVPLTLEETLEWVAGELRQGFGVEEGLAALNGPIGQERMAKALEILSDDGEELSRVFRLGGEAWRKDRVSWEAEAGAAKA
jgi:hypothetical protein